MTMRVTGPGGIAIEFPDGTDAETVNRVMFDAMKKNAEEMDAQHPTTFGEDLQKTLVAKPLQGMVDLPGIVGDVDQAASLVGGMIGDLGRRAYGFVKTGEWPERAPAPPERLLKGIAPTSPEFEDFIGFKPYEPKYTANKIIGEGLRMAVPGAVAGGVSAALRRGVSVPAEMGRSGFLYGMVPGTTSEAAGQVAEKTGQMDPTLARMAGALMGPTVVRRAITPRSGARIPMTTLERIPPENLKMARALRNEGVTGLTEGQITGKMQVKARERQAMGDRMHSINEQQGEQFTAAALRRVGENAPRATTEVIDRAYRRIGGEFDRLSRNNVLVPDQQMAADIGDTVRWYTDRVAPPNRAPIIERYIREVRERLARGGGSIDGEAYQSLRSRIAADARGINDPDTARTLRDLVEDIDDAMERSIGVNNPADLGAFAEVRRQYRNMLVIERAGTVAGSDADLGLISPSALRNATVTMQGRRAYARGQGDFAELARAGGALMRQLPETGVAPALGPISKVGSVQLPFVMATRALRELRMSPAGRRYMTNQVFPAPDRVAAALAGMPNQSRLATADERR